jgi:hypothetical protein
MSAIPPKVDIRRRIGTVPRVPQTPKCAALQLRVPFHAVDINKRVRRRTAIYKKVS